MAYHAKFTSKGQITIPVDARRALGFKNGDRVRVDIEADGIKLRPTASAFDLIGVGRPSVRNKAALGLPWSDIRQLTDEAKVKHYRRKFGLPDE